MTFNLLGSFKAGDPVPSWLLDAEPMTGGTKRPLITFQIDCHVVEIGAGYVVLPDMELEQSQVYVDNHDGGPVSLFAASRSVLFTLRYQVMGGPDDDGDDDDEEEPVIPPPLETV